jgi:CTP:molybdopterin cytidylyltransferase MocA
MARARRLTLSARVADSRDSRIAGLLLAAGEGSRLGRPKALVEIEGRTLAERGVHLLRGGGTDPVIVVTGAVAVNLAGVVVVHNPDWRSGMGSSLRAGLATLPPESEAVVVALVDQPLIGPAAVRRLIAAFGEGSGLVVAGYGGKRRNPVLIPRRYWAEVAAAAEADLGARGFLRAHQELITIVECGDIGRPDDLDTEDDLRRISDLIAKGGAAGDQN